MFYVFMGYGSVNGGSYDALFSSEKSLFSSDIVGERRW